VLPFANLRHDAALKYLLTAALLGLFFWVYLQVAVRFSRAIGVDFDAILGGAQPPGTLGAQSESREEMSLIDWVWCLPIYLGAGFAVFVGIATAHAVRGGDVLWFWYVVCRHLSWLTSRMEPATPMTA
jgi:hypothetical protein